MSSSELASCKDHGKLVVIHIREPDIAPVADTGPSNNGLILPVRDAGYRCSSVCPDPKAVGRVLFWGQPIAGCQLNDEHVEARPREWYPITELEEVPSPAGQGCEQVL